MHREKFTVEPPQLGLPGFRWNVNLDSDGDFNVSIQCRIVPGVWVDGWSEYVTGFEDLCREVNDLSEVDGPIRDAADAVYREFQSHVETAMVKLGRQELSRRDTDIRVAGEDLVVYQADSRVRGWCRSMLDLCMGAVFAAASCVVHSLIVGLLMMLPGVEAVTGWLNSVAVRCAARHHLRQSHRPTTLSPN